MVWLLLGIDQSLHTGSRPCLHYRFAHPRGFHILCWKSNLPQRQVANVGVSFKAGGCH